MFCKIKTVKTQNNVIEQIKYAYVTWLLKMQCHAYTRIAWRYNGLNA